MAGDRKTISEGFLNMKEAAEEQTQEAQDCGTGTEEDIYSWEHGDAVEPWPEAVEGKELLDGLEAEIRRYAVLGQWVAETLALWIVHTYAWQLRQVATYIGIESPE